MEFKGTKGKWKINQKGASILDSDEKSICCWYGVATSNFCKYEEELKANSQLISKSPEMLDMLKNCLTEFEFIRETEGIKSSLEKEIEKLIKEATEL